MPAPPPPSSRSSSRTSARTTATSTAQPSYNALLGANLAFLKTSSAAPSKSSTTAPHPSSPSHHDVLAVNSSTPQPGRRGGSTPLHIQPSGSDIMKEPRALGVANASRSPLSQERGVQSGTSPSHQAAVLAAARARPASAIPSSSSASAEHASYASLDNRRAVPSKPQALNRAGINRRAPGLENGLGHVVTDQPTDTTSIPPTSSLVDLFEHSSSDAQGSGTRETAAFDKAVKTPPIAKEDSFGGPIAEQSTTSLVDLFEKRSREAQDPGKKPEPIVIKPTKPLTLKSPKPMRSGITSMFQLELPENRNTSQTEYQKADRRQKETQCDTHDGRSPSEDSFASASEDLNAYSPTRSSMAAGSNTARPSTGQTWTVENKSKSRAVASPSPLRQQTKPLPIKLPQREQDHLNGMTWEPAATAHYSALSASSPRSLNSIQAQIHQAYPRKMTPLTTGDDLANALVASSLASSRAASPTRLELPPLSAHKKKHQHHSIFSFSRTPSPAKGGMPHTLRKTDSPSESEDEHHPYGKHRKKRLVRKHPNKHHEGDRKRWRDAVTERERKRYEGVWAANKGLHYSFTYKEQDFFRREPMHQQTLQSRAMVKEQVSNMVARDIWHRSRLSETILEVVWDLVDNSGVGRLQKDEFVVGMWLIDQRLKGRKLPAKVSETVWASVRGIQGIKLRK